MKSGTLFMFYAPGCPACEATMPAVAEFEKKHGAKIKIDRRDLTEIDWKARGWEPRVTPTFFFLRADREWFVKEGEATLREIEEWVHRCLEV